MSHTRFAAVLAVLLLLFTAFGCQQRPRSTAEVPKIFSPRYSIAVMPFTQPVETAELIAGQLPISQGRVSTDQLMLLDADLKSRLLSKKNSRVFSFPKVQPPFDKAGTAFHASSQPQGLSAWVNLGKQTGKDFILVPQIINWHDREGSKAGVTEPAEVQVELYLIRTDSGTVYNHTVFQERQVGLTSNLLSMGEFVKRRGAWVTARELTNEGVDSMLTRMGL